MSTTMLRSAISIAIRCVHLCQLEKHVGGNLFVCLLFCLLFCFVFLFVCCFVCLLFCCFVVVFSHFLALAFLDAGTKN